MADMQTRLDHYDIDMMKPKIESVLNGLGFSKDDFERDTGEFSGGWQMRIAMAKLLLQMPDVLLLDEPTNHLDMDSQRWIENYLKNYRGALVLISHDKGLLDLLCKRTLAFAHGRAEEYSGNYSYYLRESAARKQQRKKAKETQDKEVKQIKDFINRFRYNSKKATLVQSRIKMLNKIEIIEIDKDDSVVKFQFPQPPSSGHSVIKLEDIKKQYDDLTVFENFNLDIEKGDCIAVVGVNGAGKSTFVRLLAGVDEPTSGSIKLGHKVLPSYFSQTLAEELPLDKTIIKTVEESASKDSASSVRNVLGCFLFRGNDVFKQNKVLSGGERSRVALVRILMQPANFLIMDEPTNHLDIPSQEILQHALKKYTGTMVIVSHNRDFLDPIVNKVIEFIPNKPPTVYLGNISEYLAKKELDKNYNAKEKGAKKLNVQDGADSAKISHSLQASNVGNSTIVRNSAGMNSSPKNRKEQRKLKALLRQQYAKEVKPLKDKFEKLEKDIKALELRQQEFAKRMLEPDFASKAENITASTDCTNKINSAYKSWDKIHAELELVEANFKGM